MPLASRRIGPAFLLPLGCLPAMHLAQASPFPAVVLVVSSRPKPPLAPLAKTIPPPQPPPSDSDADRCDKAPPCGAIACRSASLVGMLRTSHGRSRLPGAARGGCRSSSSGTPVAAFSLSACRPATAVGRALPPPQSEANPRRAAMAPDRTRSRAAKETGKETYQMLSCLEGYQGRESPRPAGSRR